MLDSASIAQAAAAFMDELDEQHGDEASVLRFVVVAEIDHGDDQSSVHVRSGDDDEPITTVVGLLARGSDAILNG